MARLRQLIHSIHRRSLWRSFAATAFGILLAACSEPPADSDGQGSPTGLEARLEVREVFRLGSVDGPDEETLFGRVLGVGLDDDGNVYVLDGLAPAVRVFDSDGRYVCSLGGRGAGPGEFMRPNGLIITEDGRLWVRDTGNRRYEVFESDGTFAGSFRRNFRGGLGNLVIDPDGLIWESASTAMDPVTFARELFFVGARPLSGVMESVETVHLA